MYNNVKRLHTENKQGSRWHVATGVQVGSNLNIYNYMVVYIVVIEVMKNLLKFLGKTYILGKLFLLQNLFGKRQIYNS